MLSSFSGSSTIAAAHGKTLNENSSFYTIDANSTLNFGAPGEDGTILWHTGNASISAPYPAIDVQAGTLKGADSLFSASSSAPLRKSPSQPAQPSISAGTAARSRRSSGRRRRSATAGPPRLSTLNAVNFSGAISGALSLELQWQCNAVAALRIIRGGATFEGRPRSPTPAHTTWSPTTTSMARPPPPSSTTPCSRRRAAAASATSPRTSSIAAR